MFPGGPEMVQEKIRVALHAGDPLSYTGLASHLESRSEVVLVPDDQHSTSDVVVAAAERPSRDALNALRGPTAGFTKPVVLVTSEITEAELLAAVRCRVVSILPRGAVTEERLLGGVVAAASGGGVMPPHLVGELLNHVKRLQQEMASPRGPVRAGLTPREVDVLRLMADGLDTAEIAGRLRYSQRTVKNVIHGVTGRLKLRNRSHAVAYALRAGVI